MTGRIAVIFILVSALVAGVSVYWLQVYAFYRELGPEAASAMVVTRADGAKVPLAVTDFRGIDADSSPIRFRACFTPGVMPEDLTPYPKAVPLIAPRWFDCFDAMAIGKALETGGAQAFLGAAEIAPGVDRVIAVFPDGRAFAWNQLNGTEAAPAP